MSQTFPIPDSFIRTTIEVNGEAGRAWAERLPALLDELAQRWSLTLEPPFPRLSYNYAAPATRADGTPAVLKVGFRGPEFPAELAALKIFDGRGSVRLLAADASQGAMLLERVTPAQPLSAITDDTRAISSAVAVLKRLWRPIDPAQPHPFATVTGWGKGFARLRAHYGGSSGPFPASLFDRAERLFAELDASSAAPALLHGDLNVGNVLSAQREPWLAIDPKGLIGEPAYDTGVLLRDPLPDILKVPHPDRFLARRIAQLADELALDRQRVHGWALAQAVLSAIWTWEDHGHGWEPMLACAEILANLT